VELGEGIQAVCRLGVNPPGQEQPEAAPKADLAALSSMLQARWKGGPAAASASKAEPVRAGQIRQFRITSLDPAAKNIELELA
jgi:small subunit ribosomal protein S1